MPLELGVWRIDGDLRRIDPVPLDFEQRLESILAQDISIAAPNWMIIGRQVHTSFDKYIDLLAIDVDGNLVVLELKRDKTYRDIVAQVLDYGSWVRTLHDDDIAQVYAAYRKKYFPDEADQSLDEAFCEKFKVQRLPDELNESHELVIVASSLDLSTERVVKYLADEYDVQINAIFFQIFKDHEREYITRAWLNDPSLAEVMPPKPVPPGGKWNGEFYGSFGGDRPWDEAVKYGFFSAGGGSWYSKTLSLAEPGGRIWVNIPGSGYVGVGIIKESMVPIEKFFVSDADNQPVPITDLPIEMATRKKSIDDPEKAEYMIRVDWLKTVSIDQAIREKGFFGNQNSVARPRTPKWEHTIERLKKRFGV